MADGDVKLKFASRSAARRANAPSNGRKSAYLGQADAADFGEWEPSTCPGV
jgi:hypothetical protein